MAADGVAGVTGGDRGPREDRPPRDGAPTAPEPELTGEDAILASVGGEDDE